jgi:glycerophosphoryl diester phosphodiesterase
VLRIMLAVRTYKRQQSVDGSVDPATIELLAEVGLTEHVVVVSSDDGVLDAFEILAPEVETSPGLSELSGWILSDIALDARHRIIQVPPSFEGVQILDATFWQQVEAAGLSAWVWMSERESQENLEFYQILIAQGADGIIAGRPNEMAATTS